jgi:MFS family permease
MKHISALLTALFTITFLISPAFTAPFAGFRADQLPIPQIEPPVQPAGYAFAIWGVIYLWLIISAAYGLFRRADDAGWNRARTGLIISLALGTPWLWVANNSAIGATILIFGMLAGAIAALMTAPKTDRWWFQAPVALYAGWLTAASFVSLGSTAAGYGILTDSIGWAWIGIIGALLTGLAVLWAKPQAPEYASTLVWALVSIIVANGLTLNSVSLLAGAGIIAVLIMLGSNQRRLA